MDIISSIMWSVMIFLGGWVTGFLIHVIYLNIRDEIEANKLIRGNK
jgi:hypothetical protein